MKVYRYKIFGSYEKVVAAKNSDEAKSLLKVSDLDFIKNGMEATDQYSVGVAFSKPGAVFYRKLSGDYALEELVEDESLIAKRLKEVMNPNDDV